MTPRETTITIYDIPPSLNVIQNMHWMKRNSLKKMWHMLVYSAWVDSKKPKFDKVEVELTYYFKTKHKRDYDNYAGKWLLDGLKGCAIEDDNQDIVQSLTLNKFCHDKENPRTEILIKEIA